jgi:CheY-like chemotaxis protein
MMSLEGVRVLVIEDESPIALMIEDMLQDMGCAIAGSAATVDDALGCVEAGGLDFALLDVNLGGTSAEAVADALIKAAVPFAFASGYGRAGVPAHLQDRPVIRKPFTGADLEKVLRDNLCSQGK